MQSNSTEPLRSNEAEQYQQYRSLSFSAVVTLVFGVISLPAAFWAHMNPFMLVFPFIGTLLGLFSFFKLRKRTDEFTGLGLSKTGLMMSLVFLFGGTGFAAYVYATEVPDGYQRISFTDLQLLIS